MSGSFRLTDTNNTELFPQRGCQYYRILPGATIIVQVYTQAHTPTYTDLHTHTVTQTHIHTHTHM